MVQRREFINLKLVHSPADFHISFCFGFDIGVLGVIGIGVIGVDGCPLTAVVGLVSGDTVVVAAVNVSINQGGLLICHRCP